MEGDRIRKGPCAWGPALQTPWSNRGRRRANATGVTQGLHFLYDPEALDEWISRRGIWRHPDGGSPQPRTWGKLWAVSAALVWPMPSWGASWPTGAHSRLLQPLHAQDLRWKPGICHAIPQPGQNYVTNSLENTWADPSKPEGEAQSYPP